ncbi:TonB-dependent siderophore receptor [Cycloclasticus sp. P1]|uniref:TonB-dependent receptor plug domain-containing protein n=1 Tax=Cycloclasticus sp. (strain P1) TaxID=385025 RepID=UPI000286AC4F|nr:TonB-dependent receptor [Cycloclasticus sp. P1]AFT67462.1 TonB-dependent receptor [Cycloclasticus sp. P1]
MKKIIAWLLLTSLSFLGEPVYASDEDNDTLKNIYGDEDYLYIATGRKQTVSQAPAVASIISAKTIRQTGARDIDELLETIPGLHVSYSAGGYNPIYQIRGISSSTNPQVLMLINGTPVTNIFAGNRSQVWGGMPVENISRIEVIRGPGSAIYGADAFAGTINIITKNSTEIDGVEIGASAGSFDEYRGWLQYGGSIAGWNTAFSAQVLDTHGQHEKINKDMQTGLDTFIGTSASLAPGSVNVGRKSLDTRLDISKNEWQIQLGYQGRELDAGAGLLQALDTLGEAKADRYNADITYQNTTFSENWDFKAQYSFFNSITRSDLVLLPPGANTTGLPSHTFPDGVLAKPDIYERHNRIDLSSFYTGLKNHDVRLGIGFHHQDQYKIEEKKNYLPFGPALIPLGELVDVSDTTPFNQEKTRKIYYGFVQDAWDFAPDWTLTAGLRYDHYSDFGDTFNPRLALVWQTSYRLTSKLLYGRSFRAPSFAEQFNINNPVALGNPDLDPEIIDTYEVAFDYSASHNLKLSMNLFYYEMDDIIRFAPTTANNTGKQTGHGLEMEANWNVTNKLSIYGNYAYQSSEDKDTNSDAADAPQQQLYLRANYDISPMWSINSQLNHVRDRQRAASDLRPDISNYTTIDLTLRAKGLNPDIELALSARNLLDETVKEPSEAPGSIPDDLPLAGRAFFVELRKSFH